MTRRLTINMPQALARKVSAYTRSRGLTLSAAACELLARALDAPGPLPQWGGFRGYKCPNCQGWSVGEVDGQRICADCGWHSSEDADEAAR